MKTPAIVLLLIFFRISPSVAQDESLDSLDAAAHAAIDTTYLLSVNESLPSFRFHYRAVSDSALTIVVTKAVTGDTVQAITDEFYVRAEQFGESTLLLMMDINYDGYGDLLLLTSKHPVLGSEGYSYWLFEPQRQLFVRDQKLSELLNDNPEFDLAHWTVKTQSSGYPIAQWETDTYKFMQGSYVLIRRLKYDYLPELNKEGNPEWIWTLEEWHDGKLKMVAKQLDSGSHEPPEWARELE